MGNSRSQHFFYSYQSEDWPWVWAIRNPEILDWKLGLGPAEIQSTFETQARLVLEPLQITETLYLGSLQSVQQVQVLLKLGVTHVLNTAGPIASGPVQEYLSAGIEYLDLNAQDEWEYPILDRHWKIAHEFIQKAKKVVVHCHAGMNRSGTIVAAAVLEQHRDSMNVLNVVQHIRRIRGNYAITNEGFQEQLVAFARIHGCLGPAPGTLGSCVSDKAPSPQGSQTRTSCSQNEARKILDRLAF